MDESCGYADVLRKIGLNSHGANPKTLKRIIKEYNLSEEQLDINRSKLYSENAKRTNLKCTKKIEDIITNNVPYYSTYNLLNKLFKGGYKEHKCEICGISEWMGKDISLQLHHIDGNRNNNSLDNLQVLCPNCHSQTHNFAGKNIKNKKIKIKKEKQRKIIKPKERKKIPVSREELKKMIRTMPFVQIAKKYGVTDNAIRKWCDRYNLPRKVSVIKEIKDEYWECI